MTTKEAAKDAPKSGPRKRASVGAMAREPLRFIWRCLDKFFGDGCSTMAAALSFATFFSLPALLSLILLIVGAAMDPAEVERAILTQAGNLIGAAGADQVGAILQNARRPDVNKPAALILSILAVGIGASASFGQLQGALNKVWSVKPDPRRGQIRNYITKR